MLVGVDLKKDADVLHAAYNDARGVTAAFNLNLLARINRELGGDFDLRRFRHCAFYDAPLGRIEMHLVRSREQVATSATTGSPSRAGESIHTENSYKYSIDGFQALAAGGFEGERSGWTRTGCSAFTDSLPPRGPDPFPASFAKQRKRSLTL